MQRKVPLITNHIYHIFNKSIYGYTIFNSHQEYSQMLETIQFYQLAQTPTSFSAFRRCHRKELVFSSDLQSYHTAFKADVSSRLVRILAFCLMPTHIHFQIQQLLPDGICIFMQRIQNSYTQFFNNRHNRKGPLWQARFGNTLIKDGLGLLRNSLYIHANPVKDLKIPSAHQWPYSSYKHYLGESIYPFCDPWPHQNYAKQMEYYLTCALPGSGQVN